MCVAAIWNLKRWAVLVLVPLYVANIVVAVSSGAHWWFITGVRFIPLAPVAFYWRRMTWR